MKLIQGFTLIELMVTIAILAIIASIAAPSFSNMIEQRRLDQNKQDLLLQLSKARSQAVISRTNVTVNLNSQDADTQTVLNWIATGKNKWDSTLTTVTFNQSGATTLASDTNFSICNTQLGVSQNFTLTRFGTVVPTAKGVC